MEHCVSVDIGGRSLSISSGKVAKQSSGAVFVQYGETVVLVTVVYDNERSENGFLPLSVEYQEKIYSAGRIPGNYFKREIGRPSEKEILTSRLIDRPIRPLFKKGYNFETQIIATVLSVDHKNDPDILAMIGASAALEISEIPFNGPVASARIGLINNDLVVNPFIDEIDICDMNFVMATCDEGVVMIEGCGNIVKENAVLEAIYFGEKILSPIIKMQKDLKEKICKKVFVVDLFTDDEVVIDDLYKKVSNKFRQAMNVTGKTDRKEALNSLKNEIILEFVDETDQKVDYIKKILENIQKTVLRDIILVENKRIDSRTFDEIRPVTCEAGILPRPHGSALFTRGETQVLAILTLGSGQDEQRVETLSGEEYRQFMLHYNFPPFSVGEVKRLGAPSRRDIGHGCLAAKSLENIIPSKKKFDYTIRIVSEVLESNGSSSMGTVCAATLAMMDGGVPIKSPVSGIAMGLIKEKDKTVILSDILGDEDYAGDMDLKVAGTVKGITAFQMDLKVKGISKNIMQDAFLQAREGRLKILDTMLNSISGPRKNISHYAPKIISLKILPEKIKDVIGAGGKTIRWIQTSTNTKIEINDDGLVKIMSDSINGAEKAKLEVEKITIEPKIGQIYNGKVIKITDFGAFVQISHGVDGLLHISQLANRRVLRVKDVVKEGDIVRVKIIEISKDGKIRLSKKAVV